ncbi:MULTISPECIES: M20 aminoacylase family protein [Bartonella]|uniref:M20 aminoacylase family protein n=1 Tax=Bartonella TaxID=773 RepID=UPI0018DBD48F|nr:MULTISPECIES: M20 aminoacylase family protein [Bartonella]MBH9974780.1 amidohydrolase [Bartonella choladocola]MBI0014386.1 amidohydrolase [Bartonella sp. B10834G3]
MKHIREHIEKTIDEMVAIRHQIHENPEMGFNEHKTGDKVASLLESWGFDVVRGVGKTGIVGTLKVGNGKKVIGIRADMDALPIEEETNLPYASKNAGVMHACGHDGHTTILLTAARYLAETRNFDGTVRVIFQPAEESLGGGKKMIDDGLFEKFPCDRIYGLHNWPGFPAGTLRFTKGPMMASVDTAYITVRGKGGHGARPETTIDPIVAASSIVMALQTIVSRNVPPLEAALITVGMFKGGSVSNVIPEEVKMELTIRAFSPDVRKLLQERICKLAKSQAESYGAEAIINYERGYPVTVNDAESIDFALDVAKQIVGDKNVVENAEPLTPSEDFSYMLEKVPGAYIIMGNGDSTGLHTPQYNFNDDGIAVGATLWGALVEKYLAKA